MQAYIETYICMYIGYMGSNIRSEANEHKYFTEYVC